MPLSHPNCGHPTCPHHTAIINNLVTAGLTVEPPFNLFIPTYLNGSESFAVRMPQTYGDIMLRRPQFTAGDTVKYRLQPQEFTGVEQNKQKDTGDRWARVIMSPVHSVSDADALNFVRATFTRVGILPVDIRILEDKQMGTATNQIRVAFDLTPNFNVSNLKAIASITAPDNTIWYVKTSKGFAAQFNIHDQCLGLLTRNAPPHLACLCSQRPSAGPSLTAAQRMQAKAAHQDRARKRAREDADPFA